MTEETYDHRHEREMLGYREAEWLRSKGWTHTSSTPGCYWLWLKKIEAPHATEACPAGTVILTEQDMALALQSRMDGLEADLDEEGIDADEFESPEEIEERRAAGECVCDEGLLSIPCPRCDGGVM